MFAIVVEVQLRPDADKLWSWPAYLANLRARLRCPVLLLVMCVNARTARKVADPIELGPASTVTPWVVGPDKLPVVTDPQQARRSPELAVLSALATRGIHVPDEARTRITSCTDLDRLDRWVSRAVTADSIDDVLD